MLKFLFLDTNDDEIMFLNPLAFCINQDENVPADDMTVVFAYEDIGELKSVEVYDNDTVVFKGVVDEQLVISSSDGAYLKIIGRSMAAHLLDNESVPISYNHPSVSVIFDRHVKPFGINKYNGADSTYFGQLTINKGMTNWQALCNFCNNCLGKTPRINARGEVDLNGASDSKEIVFSNSGKGIQYEYFAQSLKRCEEISRVNIKVTNSSGYYNKVENDDAISRGILRERYINAVLTDTPMTCADTMIKNGRHSSFYVKIICPGRYIDILGNSAKIDDAICGEIDNLYVSSVKYSLNSKQNVTTIVLKRKEV